MLDLTGKRITVMGLGRFGGGIGVTQWLAAQGADILVTDLAPEADLADSISQIAPLIRSGTVRLRLGEHNVSDFTTGDIIIANPAVPRPWENRFLRAADAAGLTITTEIGLLVSRLPARERTIGITGSVGKSTSTAMVHHALQTVLGPSQGRVVVGGNLGGSLLPVLQTITPETWVVLELSSAQLCWLSYEWAGKTSGRPRLSSHLPDAHSAPSGWSPHIALCTNLSPNHLDWHGDLDHYTRSKQLLIHAMLPTDTAVLVDPAIHHWADLTRARTLHADPAAWTLPMLLPGAHNRLNAIGALEACSAAIGSQHRPALAHAIATFGGLEHRLQLVCEHQLHSPSSASIRCYNDSKSTTPESALRAIDAVASVIPRSRAGIHLIAGGYDKQISLQPVADAARSLAALYTIGATGPSLAAAARAAGATVHESGTLDIAVRAALAAARDGDALLLSPACASWDQYINFEARGNEFIRLVRQ